MSKKGLKKFFGLDLIESSKLKDTINKFRLVFFIYIGMCILYVLFFMLLKRHTEGVINFFFKNSFATSLSASILEDLLLFIFFGLSLAIVSTILSTKSPGEYDFDSRIKAIMNSKNVKNEDQVFLFLKSKIEKLLAFNKTMKLDIVITDHFEVEKTYQFKVTRTHLMTNMCNDKSLKTEIKKLFIHTDDSIEKDFGQLLYLGEVATHDLISPLKPFLDDTDKKYFKYGLNEVEYPFSIEGDCEKAYQLIYNCYHSYEKEDDLNNFYLKAKFYTEKIKINIINKTSKAVRIQVIKVDSENVSLPVQRATIILPYVPSSHNRNPPLLEVPIVSGLVPGEAVRLYFNDQIDIN